MRTPRGHPRRTRSSEPVKRREGAPKTYTVPKKRKRIQPRKSSAQTGKAASLEAVLSDEVYEEILSIMDNMVTVMER